MRICIKIQICWWIKRAVLFNSIKNSERRKLFREIAEDQVKLLKCLNFYSRPEYLGIWWNSWSNLLKFSCRIPSTSFSPRRISHFRFQITQAFSRILQNLCLKFSFFFVLSINSMFHLFALTFPICIFISFYRKFSCVFYKRHYVSSYKSQI